MAGNAREWCLNQTGSERYILGGGWNDPTYAFNDAYAQDPFDRSPTNGFGWSKYLSDDNLAVAPAADRPRVSRLQQGAAGLGPGLRRLPPDVRLRSHQAQRGRGHRREEQTDDWVREKVYFDAAYNHERMAAYLYLPKRGKPPYQTVVFFPGSNAIHDRSSSKDISAGASTSS